MKTNSVGIKITFKGLTSFFLALSFIFTGVINMLGRADDITFYIDASEAGAVIGNKLSNVNMWAANPLASTDEENMADFVEYIQIMQATGGSAERDLFVDPYDRENLYDYDFTKLINTCRSILRFGAKPHIKTGNVPMKYSANSSLGTFGVNVFPPDDYNVYYKYINAIGQALVNEFGAEEVLSWRFGVFTEYENQDWFYFGEKDPAMSLESFCKIYDYTVAALQASIGENIFIGAHSMTVSEGLWDERDFIEHVANGTNYFTGEKGTRICFLSASFYDIRPGLYNLGTDLPSTIAVLRDKAESVGLVDLIYGVDEGRILIGNVSGASSFELNLRICGFTWQAAYDARLLRQAVDFDIDYISSWGYLSGGFLGGIPTVSCHVARKFSEFGNMRQLEVLRKGAVLQTYVESTKGLKEERDISAVAALSEDGSTMRIMAYNFKNDLSYDRDRDTRFAVSAPDFGDKEVKITSWVVDDNANYFDEWQADRIKYNITDDCFSWSPDDPAIDTYTTLSTQWARDLYYSQLREGYRECAKLVPVETTARFSHGKLNIDLNLGANTVVFYEITVID